MLNCSFLGNFFSKVVTFKEVTYKALWKTVYIMYEYIKTIEDKSMLFCKKYLDALQ